MIRVLPDEVVNQIAAGEVVERPFSVVKELCENSLDAGATRLRIELRDGGRALIRVIDDGAGMAAADLGLAFEGHATSKLSSLEDLDHIGSLGFRGEALASIGSVSRASIRSRPAGAGEGFEVRCEGGRQEPPRPCGTPLGTLVEVRDLFFNTPARRRFLRTPQAERARIQDLVARLALARLDVDFTLESDGRETLRLPAGETLRDRVGRTFGREVARNLLDVRREWGRAAVQGLCGEPDLARRDSTLELLYVNGRCARDRAAGQAVRQVYREFLMGGRFPIYFLMLSLPPDEVDVNVHPTKAEVRFVEGRQVCGMLHDAVRAALAARGGAAVAGAVSVGEHKPRARSGFPALPRDLFGPAPLPGPPALVGLVGLVGLAGQTPPPSAAAGGRNPFADAARRRFLQVKDLYLVFEGEDGLCVVDQHALHERVLFERLERRYAERRAVEVQRLLVPEVVELTAADKAWLLEARDVLAEEGLLLDDFGGNAVAVHGVPAALPRARPGALVESLLGGDAGGDPRPSSRAAIAERFHSMACRSAVMSGDPLTEAEIQALLDEASRLRHPHNCPHGRPTVLTFSAAELERFFRRRV